jgi:hypothetical protein
MPKKPPGRVIARTQTKPAGPTRTQIQTHVLPVPDGFTREELRDMRKRVDELMEEMKARNASADFH